MLLVPPLVACFRNLTALTMLFRRAYRDCKKEWVGNTPVLENHMVDPIIPASLTTIQLAKRKEDRAKMP